MAITIDLATVTDHAVGFALNAGEWNSRYTEMRTSFQNESKDMLPRQILKTFVAGEDLSLGDAVRISGATVLKCDNGSAAGVTGFVGLCGEGAISSANVRVIVDMVNGIGSLTSGSFYYLGASGAITSTRPSSNAKAIGIAKDTSDLMLIPTLDSAESFDVIQASDGTILLPSYTFETDATSGMSLVSGDLVFSLGGIEHFRVDTSGATFETASGTDNILTLEANGNADDIQLRSTHSGTEGFRIGIASNLTDLIFRSSSSGGRDAGFQFINDAESSTIPLLKMDNNGNVGLAVTTPLYRFHVVKSTGIDNDIGLFLDVEGTASGNTYTGQKIQAVNSGTSSVITGLEIDVNKDDVGVGDAFGLNLTVDTARDSGANANSHYGITTLVAGPNSASTATNLEYFGGYFEGKGALSGETSTEVYGGYFKATQGSTNWAIFADDGNVNIENILHIGFNSDNTNMTQGITINQGNADDEILTLVADDIDTGLVSIADTNVFATFGKVAAGEGGLKTICIADTSTPCIWDVNAYALTGYNSTKSTSAIGGLQMTLYDHDGADTIGDIGANANVFVVRARTNGSVEAKFIVDEDGDLFADGGVATTDMVTLFDEEDDFDVLRGFELVRHGHGAKGLVRNEFDKFVKTNEARLIELGIIGAPIKEGGMINITRLQQLQTGALCQMGVLFKRMEKRLRASENTILQLQGA